MIMIENCTKFSFDTYIDDGSGYLDKCLFLFIENVCIKIIMNALRKKEGLQ